MSVALTINNTYFWKNSRGALTGSAAEARGDLFSGAELGMWLDPWDKSTLFQDSAGATPVAADGDPVGLILDKSGNEMNFAQTDNTKRPTWKTDDTHSWLEFSLGDTMESTRALDSDDRAVVAAVRITGGDSRKTIIEGYGSANAWLPLALDIREDNKLATSVSAPVFRSTQAVALDVDAIMAMSFDYQATGAVILREDGVATLSDTEASPLASSAPSGLRIFANRDGIRRAEGRLYALAFIQKVADMSAIEAAFAERCSVTLP